MLKKKGKVAPPPHGVISLPEPTYQYSRLQERLGNGSLLFPMEYLLNGIPAENWVSGAKAKRRMGVSHVCPTARIWGEGEMKLSVALQGRSQG